MVVAVYNKTDGVVAATYQHVVQILDESDSFVLRSDIESFTRSFPKSEFSYYNVSGLLAEASDIKGSETEAADAERVADVMVNVGEQYDISAEELRAAFEKSGAAMARDGE